MVLHWFKRQSDFKINWGGNQPPAHVLKPIRGLPLLLIEGVGGHLTHLPHPRLLLQRRSGKNLNNIDLFGDLTGITLFDLCNQLIAHSFALTGLCFTTGCNCKDNRYNVKYSNLFYKTVLKVGCCLSCSPERVVLERGNWVDRRVVLVVEALVQQLVHTLAVFCQLTMYYIIFKTSLKCVADVWHLKWVLLLLASLVNITEPRLQSCLLCGSVFHVWDRNGVNSERFSSVNN